MSQLMNTFWIVHVFKNPAFVSFIKNVIPCWFYGINEILFLTVNWLTCCNLSKHEEDSKIVLNCVS